jgi:hypothetical protein
MTLRTYASEEEKFQHWQNILDKYADNCVPELSLELSNETGIKLENNEAKASQKTLFDPQRAKEIFNHIGKIIED